MQDTDHSPMTPYRVAFLLCKAMALGLWIGAAFGLLSLVVGLVTSFLGWPNFGFFNNWSWIIQGIIALLLGVAAPSLSASLVAQSSLQGEAIASRQALSPADKRLVRAGAGLITLCFGAADWIGALPATYSFWMMGMPQSSAFTSFIVIGLVLGALKVGAGFLLAFWPALKRIVRNTKDGG